MQKAKKSLRLKTKDPHVQTKKTKTWGTRGTGLPEKENKRKHRMHDGIENGRSSPLHATWIIFNRRSTQHNTQKKKKKNRKRVYVSVPLRGTGRKQYPRKDSLPLHLVWKDADQVIHCPFTENMRYGPLQFWCFLFGLFPLSSHIVTTHN